MSFFHVPFDLLFHLFIGREELIEGEENNLIKGEVNVKRNLFSPSRFFLFSLFSFPFSFPREGEAGASGGKLLITADFISFPLMIKSFTPSPRFIKTLTNDNTNII